MFVTVEFIVPWVTYPQTLGPVGLPLGFRLLVIFSHEVTLFLCNVRPHNCVLPGVSLHVFECAKSALIDQFDIHQEIIFAEFHWVVHTLSQRDRHHGLPHVIRSIEAAFVKLDEALFVVTHYEVLSLQGFPTSPYLPASHRGLSGDQVECEREEVEGAAQGLRIERKPDCLLGRPLTSRALLLALLPVLASLLLRFFLLFRSLIFLFLAHFQFQILWPLFDRSDQSLSDGDHSVGVLHHHL